jgi:hypothetical protein
LNNIAKNRYIHKNSLISENFITNPESNMKIEKKEKSKKNLLKLKLEFQHRQEMYKINTTTPLIYTKIIKYLRYTILNI